MSAPCVYVYKISTPDRTQLNSAQRASTDADLFHDLLLRSYLYHCVWNVITAHNLTPEKRDNNYSHHPLTPTACLRNNIQLISGISPCCETKLTLRIALNPKSKLTLESTTNPTNRNARAYTLQTPTTRRVIS